MTIITVDGRRVGMTQCVLCGKDITLAELAIGNAALSHRINADSANGYSVVHNACVTRDPKGGHNYVDFQGIEHTYGDSQPFPYEENPW